MNLVKFDEIKNQIDVSKDFKELSKMHDTLEFLKTACKQQNECIETINKAQKYKIRIEMKIGKAYSDLKRNDSNQYASSSKLTMHITKSDVLKEIKKSRQAINLWVNESQYTEKKLDEYENFCNEVFIEMSSAGFIRFCSEEKTEEAQEIKILNLQHKCPECGFEF